jgi:hypothetical protein
MSKVEIDSLWNLSSGFRIGGTMGMLPKNDPESLPICKLFFPVSQYNELSL